VRTTAEGFRFVHPVAVRFRDIDVGGHAHHSQVLIYIEEARAEYWRRVAGRPTLEDVDYILAEATVRFRQRVLYPGTLLVAVRATVLGKKHFEMEYEVRSGTGDLLATARTVQVMYDYAAGSTKRIPEDVAAAVAEMDGPFESGR
jgi:acyl-CoA thioester hydrolase